MNGWLSAAKPTSGASGWQERNRLRVNREQSKRSHHACQVPPQRNDHSHSRDFLSLSLFYHPIRNCEWVAEQSEADEQSESRSPANSPARVSGLTYGASLPPNDLTPYPPSESSLKTILKGKLYDPFFCRVELWSFWTVWGIAIVRRAEGGLSLRKPERQRVNGSIV